MEPVRKIKANNRSITGMVPKIGEFESSLERDFLEILRFQPLVQEVYPQPLVITYLDELGKERTFTPDGLIRFQQRVNLHPILFEVKYRADFRKDWRNLLRKFRAAKRFCVEKGWVFRVYTEYEIRTNYLWNVKFLMPYKERKVSPGWKERILTVMADLEEADPEFLLFALSKEQRGRAELIPKLWHLIAMGEIGCDLDERLTMRSRIWTKADI